MAVVVVRTWTQVTPPSELCSMRVEVEPGVRVHARTRVVPCCVAILRFVGASVTGTGGAYVTGILHELRPETLIAATRY